MILCCGEALIDFVPLPQERAYQPCPGGSIYNVAVGLGRLGTPVGFYCKVSTDFFGDMLIDYLEENQVETGFCVRSLIQPRWHLSACLQKNAASRSSLFMLMDPRTGV